MRTRAPVAGWLIATSIIAGCSAPVATTQPTDTPLPAQRTISGTISYSGAAFAPHRIVVVAVRSGDQGPPAYSALLPSAGPYALTNVADASYTVLAFIDLGDDMGAPLPGEPQGFYDTAGDGDPDPVAMLDGKSVAGVDITIRDQ